MWTGRQTLEQLDGVIAKLHRQETELDSALASATAEAERVRRERTDAFRELARVKLDEITARRLVDNLDAAEARAVRLLEGRRRQLEEITTERQKALAAVERTEAERSAAAAALEDVIADLETLRSRIEGEVRKTPEWAEAKAVWDRFAAIAVEADKKANLSEEELSEKRKPYDKDPLFRYLWSIGFGTTRYNGGLLARFLDRMVARHIGFADARANYAMLTEITVRLREHARLQQAAADERKGALAAIESAALVAAGVEAKEAAVRAARDRLASADEAMEKARASLRELDKKRDELVAGSDDATYREALETIAAADAQDPFSTLIQEAKRTATPADDAIVRRIGDLNARIERVEAEIADLRKTGRTIAERRVEMERGRDRFRGAGYDHPDVTFNNENQLGKVLGQVLEGVVRSGILWDLLRAGFGLRKSLGRPDFGGRPFPFPFPTPGERTGTRGGAWRRREANGGWIPPIGFPPEFGDREGGRDYDDDDRDRGGFSTGGRF
jgi:chromosome segregation ATPase